LDLIIIGFDRENRGELKVPGTFFDEFWSRYINSMGKNLPSYPQRDKMLLRVDLKENPPSESSG
jgi:hypothetical protein